MCADDEMLAFVVAHELAHHDLDHVQTFPESLRKITGDEVGHVLLALFRSIEARIYGPEQECDADRYAIELCVNAGYDPHRCIKVFDILEKRALDVGDLNAVFGPDPSDDELHEEASMTAKLRIWLYQRKFGYLPIRDRRQMILDHLARIEEGARG